MPELIDRRAPPSDTPAMILAGGIALIGGALAFMAVFSYLAAHFRYPEVLDGPADQEEDRDEDDLVGRDQFLEHGHLWRRVPRIVAGRPPEGLSLPERP